MSMCLFQVNLFCSLVCIVRMEGFFRVDWIGGCLLHVQGDRVFSAGSVCVFTL